MRPPPGSSSESTWSSVTLPTRIMVLSPSGRPENFVTSTSEAGSYCRNKSTWLIAGVTAESGAWAEESSCEREHPTRSTSIGTAIQDTHDKRLAAIEGPTLYQKVNVGFRATIWGDGSTGFGRLLPDDLLRTRHWSRLPGVTGQPALLRRICSTVFPFRG